MKNKGGTVLIIMNFIPQITLALLLMAAALFLALFNLRENDRAEETAADTVQQLMAALHAEPAESIPEQTDPAAPAESEEVEIPDYILDPNREMPVQNIYGYDYIGMLEIPSLDLLLPVMAQWDYTRLQIAPCRYSGSPYLGNFVIAAHNYPSHFGNLYTLSEGDEVTFTDMERNVFTYAVVAVETLQPTAVEDMTSGDYDLSLFTCTVGGNYRVTVRCDVVLE